MSTKKQFHILNYIKENNKFIFHSFSMYLNYKKECKKYIKNSKDDYKNKIAKFKIYKYITLKIDISKEL